jgi:hypothetical protein
MLWARRHNITQNAHPCAADSVEPGRTVKLATFAQHLWRVTEAHTGKHLAFIVVRDRTTAADSDVLRIVIT